jgi:hypothetical protein
MISDLGYNDKRKFDLEETKDPRKKTLTDFTQGDCYGKFEYAAITKSG